MANGKMRFGKQSGGTLGLVFPDGVTNTEVTLPESGTVVNVDGSVTDNAIARYDGTTGKLQNSGVTIDDAGNLLLTLGTGGIGYGTGAGGTVTQLTSKSTAVTLNKPSGRITMHNAALAAGAIVVFSLSNSLINDEAVILANLSSFGGSYELEPVMITGGGGVNFYLKNKSASALSDAVVVKFAVVKGATA